jgi:hypothetical protein
VRRRQMEIIRGYKPNYISITTNAPTAYSMRAVRDSPTTGG